ncbi:hypothetical protein FQR65_LT04208 [Abscondita terminalis]|nr:hypothetical protein FQR65_LT04208 [Abscondita terminalis]
MDTSRQSTPKKVCAPIKPNEFLLMKETKRKLNYSLYWGGCNSCLLGVLIYDIYNTSPIHFTSILYIEYLLSVIFFLNLLYHMLRYIMISRSSRYQVPKPNDPMVLRDEPEYLSYSLFSSSSQSPFQYEKTPTKSSPRTPINTSAVSWLSTTSPLNTSGGRSPNTLFTSPNSFNNASMLNSYYESSGSEFINDEQSLVEYLHGYENYEKNANSSYQNEQSSNLMSTFWNHTSHKSLEVPYSLKNCNYQLSPTVPASKNTAQFDKANNTNNRTGVEVWRELNVTTMILTEWNANIRMTILERLCKQFDQIDSDLQKQGYSDVQVGYVGLEHLRKTSQMPPVLHYIPTLSILIPFLEVCSNQEYLVKRIKELGKGVIIMHLFATYMDIQLPPIPNRPDIKPFSDCHYVKLKQDIPSGTTIAIQQVIEKPPHFCVVIDNKVFEMVQGYNNLFHALLFFLYQVNEKEYGMLGGINLGKSGINILWVINK